MTCISRRAVMFKEKTGGFAVEMYAFVMLFYALTLVNPETLPLKEWN